jgi:hypothetical protein
MPASASTAPLTSSSSTSSPSRAAEPRTNNACQLAPVGVDGKDLFISYFENGPQDWSFADGRAQYVEGDLSVPKNR